MSESEIPTTEGEEQQTIENVEKEELQENTPTVIADNAENNEEIHTETKETEEAKEREEVQPLDDDEKLEVKEEPLESEAGVVTEEAAEGQPVEENINVDDQSQIENLSATINEESVAEQNDSLSANVSSKFEVESQMDPLLEDLEEQEGHPLDELTDQQVIDLVNEVETENRHLELENALFENFLKENDPSLLEGMDEIMAQLSKKTDSRTSSKEFPDRPSLTVRLKLDSYTSITSIAEGKGPKINIAQKTDMVMRAMEEIQASLETFLKKSHIAKRNLKSELEEFSIREVEIKEASDIFEYNVVTQGYDKLTQRIPAEKFVRYMEEWLKSAQLQIEKLRLRIATLKVQYKKVSQQLIQRQELGENVHAVDFDQLEIENKHFIEKIEQKNNHLIELKKMNGGANLVLSTHKKFLQKQQEDCNKLKQEIEIKNAQIEATEKECDEAEDELNEVYEKYEHCKNLKNQYTVPDVMEYVRLKGKLYELRKNIKIWSRRRKIQDIALNTCLREMKNLTGKTNIDPSWFEDHQSLDSQGSSSEDMLL